jgi:nucleotide-binding universal stress UspA family protein
MFQSMILPLDGSSFAEEAVPLAGLLARAYGAQLHLVHVIRPSPDVDFKTPEQDLEWRTKVREAASGALGEMAGKLRREGVNARAEVREGRVVDTLLACAEERKADLAVLTTHGAGGFRRWWLGSVADALLRRSEVPVLLVRPWDDTRDRTPEEPRFRTILVPLDGSRSGEKALPYAQSLRERLGAKLVLVQVVPSPLEVGTLYGIPSVKVESEPRRRQKEAARAYLEEVAGRLGESGGGEGEVEIRVMETSGAAEGILEAVRVTGADLLVLSTHGRGGFSRAVVGSVADKVIRGAVPPVLAIRAHEDHGDHEDEEDEG